MHPSRRHLAHFALLLMAFGSESLINARHALADEPSAAWSRFRGENSTGVVSDCTVPLPWTKQDIAWDIRLPGVGNGSPIVYGDRVFLMSADPDSAERYLLCYDLGTGQELWRETIASTPHRLHSRNTYASSTACVDERAVYFAWAAPDAAFLKALTHEGKEIWTKNLGTFVSQHGFGASPALFHGKLVLFVSQQEGDLAPGEAPGYSRVLAFDPATGEILWETPRTNKTVCYGTPSLFQDESGQPALLFANTGEGLFALSLETGKPLWNKTVFTKRVCSSPQIVGNLAIGTEGSGGGGNKLFAVNLGGDHELQFEIDRAAPYVPTPVSTGDLLFLWDDKGIVTCLRLPGGETVWLERIGGNVSSSPVIAGGKLVGISEDGTVTILAASEAFQNLGSIKLGDTTRATPLVSKDFMLVRTESRLLCIGKP